MEHTQNLPVIQMGRIKNDMAAFTAEVEKFVVLKQSALQLRKQQHIGRISELETRKKLLKSQSTTSRDEYTENRARMEAKFAKFRATENIVGGLREKLERAQAQMATLEASVHEKTGRVKAADTDLHYARTHISLQTQRDTEELTKFEMYAGLKVERIDDDVLRFRFSNIDTNDIDSEVTCDVHVGGDLIRIGATDPKLPPDVVSDMEHALAQHNVFVRFLKQIRKALRDAME